MNAQQANAVLRYFNLIFTSIVVPIGVIVNAIAVFVFFQKVLNNNTMNGFMNAFLCIYNIIALLNIFFITQFMPALGVNVLAASQFTCKFFTAWRLVFVQLPSLQQILITCFFYISIRYPARYQFYKSSKLVGQAMALVFIFLWLADMSTFWYNQTVIVINNTTVIHTCQGSWEIALSFDILFFGFRAVIPFTTLLFLNIKILEIINSSKRRVSQNRLSLPNNGQPSSQPPSQNKYGKAILCINVLVFIFYTPWMIGFILNYVLGRTSLSSSVNMNILRLYYSISISFTYFFNCSPFFVNMYFNRLFRQEFLRICSILIKRKPEITRTERISSLTNNENLKR